jgi:hypothetical protein
MHEAGFDSFSRYEKRKVPARKGGGWVGDANRN